MVLPTKTVPQGISALMVLDPEGEEGDNTAAMSEAVHRLSPGQQCDFCVGAGVVENLEGLFPLAFSKESLIIPACQKGPADFPAKLEE